MTEVSGDGHEPLRRTRAEPRPRTVRWTPILLASALLLAGVSACASQDSSPQLPAPIMITEDQRTAECAVGENIVIVIAVDEITGTTVESSDMSLLSVSQAYEEGGASFNAGGQCLAPGEVLLTVQRPDGVTRTVEVTISP